MSFDFCKQVMVILVYVSLYISSNIPDNVLLFFPADVMEASSQLPNV